MRKTKNDLSSNHTKLDYAALLKTAEVAYCYTLAEINSLHNWLRDLWREPQTHTSFYLKAEYLANAANNLVVVAETLHTLREMATREELEVVNRPNAELEAVARYHGEVAAEMDAGSSTTGL